MPLSQLMKKVSLSAINSSNRINISFPIYSTQLYATNCWSCKRLFDEKQSKGLLCPCSKAIIQPVNSKINYFELFNFPIEYKINQIELTRSFRNLMKLLHPDKFSNKSETEKQYSGDQSAFVTNAYKILNDDLERAYYLLKLKNFDKDVEHGTNMDQDFLFDILEMNEKATNLKNACEIIAFENEILNNVKTHTMQLQEEFTKENLNNAFKTANKLRFYRNLYDTVKEIKLKFGIQE